MTQQDKELLLRDLCARLPYGVKLDFYSKATNQHYISTLLGIEPDGDRPIIAKVADGAYTLGQNHIKPYLRPMSSMTHSEYDEYLRIKTHGKPFEVIDWLNARHIDYRKLIEKGLAIAVTDENNLYKI